MSIRAPTCSRTPESSPVERSCSRSVGATTTGTGTTSTPGGCSKIEDAIAELRELEVPELPDIEDESVVTTGRGYGSSHALLVAYARLLESVDRVIQYHFELLNLGYAAYVGMYELCRGVFPDISDQTIASLLSGADLLPLRPDDELKCLARLAIELGVADEVKAAAGEDQLRIALEGSTAGVQWLSRLDASEGPMVLLLVRKRTRQPSPIVDRRHEPAARDDRLVHRTPRGRRGDLALSRRSESPSAIASPRSTASSCPSRHVSRSTSGSRSRAPCSRTWRTTASTSTTGT